MPWVVAQHGELYGREHGWNHDFETMVADIATQMLKDHQPDWEQGWIAEHHGERVGSAFVVRKSPGVAQLRLVIVTPQARGLGLGAQLTDECLAFARAKGYQRMVLWTNANLTVARAMYAHRGFTCVSSEPYVGYGHQLTSEHWELNL